MDSTKIISHFGCTIICLSTLQFHNPYLLFILLFIDMPGNLLTLSSNLLVSISQCQKIFYNRSSNICAIQSMSFNPPFPSIQLKIINPFHNSRISANYDKGQEFQPIMKPLYPSMFLQFRIFFIVSKLKLFLLFLC